MWAQRRASAWHDDYVVDVEYTDPLMLWLNPERLSFACVMNGQPPLPRTRPLVWVELGCGNGLQACAVAAGDPGVQVWACDFNPAHIERARQRAEAAGLDNCTFVEASFQQLVDDPSIGPNHVDVVVAHGVFTWVSKHNRALIGEFVRQRLRPGGLVYVSHSVSTGWSSIASLAETMRLSARGSGLRSDDAVLAAVHELRRVADAGAAFFPMPLREQDMVDSWPERDPRYLAHDFLVGRYEPVMFDEVAEVMAAAQCVYVGDAVQADQNPEWRAPEALRPVLESAADLVEREMLRDVISQRGFRCDVFRRGDLHPSIGDLEQWVGDIRLIGLGKALQPDETVPLAYSTATLDAAFLQPVLAALHEGPISLRALRAIHPDLALDDLRYIASLLVRGEFAAPMVPGWDGSGAVESCRRFNRMVIGENGRGADHGLLLAPATGSFVAVDPVEAIALGEWWNGDATEVDTVADAVIARLRATGRVIRENGELLDDPAREREVARARAATARDLHDGVAGTLGLA